MDKIIVKGNPKHLPGVVKCEFCSINFVKQYLAVREIKNQCL